jgi:hypothetical protein
MTYTEHLKALTHADDKTVAHLVDATYLQVPSWQRDDAKAAVLELIKSGISAEEIITTHLSACADIASLGYSMTDAAQMVAAASTQFDLGDPQSDRQSIRLLASFVRLVAEKARRVR